MDLAIGYVVRTHPGDHSVDMVLNDGRRLTGVQVTTPNGSARTGTFDMPSVPEKADPWDITKLTGQDQKAIVAFIDRMPVVLGYLTPQVNQMNFDDPKIRIERHQSDVIKSIDGDGNIQLAHPSGMFVRIGESPEFVDHAAKNNDASLAVDRNTGRRVHMHIQMAGNTASISISPEGKIVVHADEDVEVHTKKNASITTGEDAEIKATGNVSVTADGWGQFVCKGPMLVKSGKQLRLKGSSGELVL